MKRIAAILAFSLLISSLSACGKKEEASETIAEDTVIISEEIVTEVEEEVESDFVTTVDTLNEVSSVEDIIPDDDEIDVEITDSDSEDEYSYIEEFAIALDSDGTGYIYVDGEEVIVLWVSGIISPIANKDVGNYFYELDDDGTMTVTNPIGRVVYSGTDWLVN